MNKVKIMQIKFKLLIQSKYSLIKSWIKSIRITQNFVHYSNKFILISKSTEKYQKILPDAQN